MSITKNDMLSLFQIPEVLCATTAMGVWISASAALSDVRVVGYHGNRLKPFHSQHSYSTGIALTAFAVCEAAAMAGRWNTISNQLQSWGIGAKNELHTEQVDALGKQQDQDSPFV